MAKRFTDTNKWGKGFFTELSTTMKVVWIYLCDNCDHAGVWDINMPLLSFHVGEKISIKDLESNFDEKISIHGDKIFLETFIDFQYGKLNPNNKVHKSVIKRLEKLGASKGLASPKLGASSQNEEELKGLGRGLEGAKDKAKDKDKDKDKERSSSISKFSFYELVDLYPKPTPRPEKVMQALALEIKSANDFVSFKRSIQNYTKQCEREGRAIHYYKSLENFISEWRFWLTHKPEKTDFEKSQENFLSWAKGDQK